MSIFKNSAGHNWRPGAKVLAYFDEDGYWYPAQIIQLSRGNFRIRYLIDNEEETVDESYLSDLQVEVDDAVECFYEPEDEYYSAVVRQVKGERVEVEYDDDGEREWTDIAHLRYGEEWEVGERAFAYWDEDGYYYPATVTSVDEDDIAVRFDDGATATLAWEDLEELILDVDDEVESKSSKDDTFYPAVVVSIDGEKVQVEYEDGSQEWTIVSKLRISLEDEEE